MGFYQNFSLTKYILSFAVIILSTLFFRTFTFTPSIMLLIFIYFILFLPSSTLYAFETIPSDFYFKWSLIFFFILFIFSIPLKINFKNTFFTINVNKISKFFLYFVLISILTIYIYIFGTEINFNLFSLASEEVYGTRSSVSEIKKNLGLFNYILSNIQTAILPLLVGIALIQKDYIYLVLTLSLFLFIFLVTSYKMILFAPSLIIISFATLFNNSGNRVFLITLASFYLLFLSLSFIIDYFFDFKLMNFILVRRILFLPTLVSSHYFDLFQSSGFTNFTDLPLMNFFTHNPFDYKISSMVGEFYFNRPDMNANANFIADSYSKFGMFSAFLYAIILRIICLFMDCFSYNKSSFLLFAIFLIPIFSITNSSITATLLTHGLLFSIVLSLFLVEENYI